MKQKTRENKHQIVKYLAKAILDRNTTHPLRVGIDGVPASGKTTLSNDLAEELKKSGRQVIYAAVDGFHNPKKTRYRKGRESPEGYLLDSYNNQAVIDNLLIPLGPGGSLEIKTAIFDFLIDSEVEIPVLKAVKDAILVMEGIFLFRPELTGYWDLKIFLDIDFSISLDRALGRDGYYLGNEADIREMYEKRYIPGQMLYFAASKPKEQADILIDNNDFGNPRVIRSSIR